MTRDVPQNEVRTASHMVSASALTEFFEALHHNSYVLKIEHEPAGANFKVTVHYAIMDLELQLAGVSGFIERAANEANAAARDSS